MWSFTTGDTTVSSLWPETAVPANSDGGDTNASSSASSSRSRRPASSRVCASTRAREHRHPRRSQQRADGTGLADVTFSEETASGWQYAAFASPVPVTPGTTYVVTHHAPNGHYAVDHWYFSAARSSGSLVAPADGAVASERRLQYGPGGSMPANTYAASNYWVDVRFRRT